MDSFALADGWMESESRYSALRVRPVVRIDLGGDGLLVKPDVAARQMREDAEREGAGAAGGRPPIEGA